MLSILLPAFLAAAQAEPPTEQGMGAKSAALPAPERRSPDAEFVQRGFLPIEEMQAGDRNVRRLILRDPYGFLPIPGLELEKRKDGTITLRHQFWAWRTKAEPLAEETWTRLAEKDSAAFAHSPSPLSVPDRGRGSPPGICHGWLAILQTSSGATTRWWECTEASSPVRDYALDLIAIAMASGPQCKDNSDPFWRFAHCFALKDELDDPTLGAAFQKIKEDFRKEGDPQLRVQALKQAEQKGLTLGTPEWLDARATILKLGQELDRKRTQLQQLRRLHYNSKSATEADREKLRQAIENWNSTLDFQTQTYAYLMGRLVKAKPPSNTIAQ